MIFISIILLLLSNAITSRRDKSILYSRATITILLMAAFIAYDNLFILFLAKGIGIFGTLFISAVGGLWFGFKTCGMPEELLSLANILALLFFNSQMKILFLRKTYKFISSVCKHLMLNQIQLYLTLQCTILLNKYPFLYKLMDYFFTILAGFHSYLYSIGFRLHNKFKNNFPILYSITVYIYSEYLAIINGNLSRNMGVIISLYVLYDPIYSNILLFAVLLLNVLFKQHLIEDVWIRSNYPILYKLLLDISTLINTILIFYFLDFFFTNIKPFILKVWNGLLKMTGNEDNHNNEPGSDSDKTPGKNPQEPKDHSDSEYYINKHGKRVKRYYKKRTEEQKKRKNELDKENRRRKAEAEGRKLNERESLVGLTEQEKDEHNYAKRRQTILSKREEDFKKYPILKDITRRNKNKMMNKEEIEEFDRISIENRKISKAKYWDANKDRIELKRPGRSSRIYRDKHNLYEDPNYVKPIENEQNIKFVQSNSKGKDKEIIHEENLPEERLDKGKDKEIIHEENLPEERLDKGKGKAKEDEVIRSSGSEYSENNAFEEDINEAIRQSRNYSNKKGEFNNKGESSKKGGSK